MNNIESYPHDNDLYLFQQNLINRINNAAVELLIKLGLDKDVGDKNLLIENIKELTINDDREVMLAAITANLDLA